MELRSGSFTFPKARDIELRTDTRSFNPRDPAGCDPRTSRCVRAEGARPRLLDRRQFQVLATEGIRTGHAESGFFRVPRKPRQVVIVSDPPHAEIAQGETVRFRGFAFSPDSGSVAPHDLV
jgi:hypothetical protein